MLDASQSIVSKVESSRSNEGNLIKHDQLEVFIMVDSMSSFLSVKLVGLFVSNGKCSAEWIVVPPMLNAALSMYAISRVVGNSTSS